jgi:hypothetical protein
MTRKTQKIHKTRLIVYFLICILISGFALSTFAKIIEEVLEVNYNFKTETLMVILQVPFQWLFMLKNSWHQKIIYSFIALSVSLVGSILLLPIISISYLYQVSNLIAIAYFFLVVAVIFTIHFLLISKENLPARLGITWVAYRCLILAYLLIPR